MGPKITVDSSTLMNKGLEVIEAHELFGTPYDRIEVVVHPQSVVHSMVEFTDGATVAQLSLPDMRLCIGYALAWPDRLAVALRAASTGPTLAPPRLRAARPRHLPLPRPRLRRRPGRRAGAGVAQRRQRGGRRRPSSPGALPWSSIPDVLERVLDRHDGGPADSVDAVIDADRRARRARPAS